MIQLETGIMAIVCTSRFINRRYCDPIGRAAYDVGPSRLRSHQPVCTKVNRAEGRFR